MSDFSLFSSPSPDALLAFPLHATTDFTVLATYSEHIAEALMESDKPAQQLALYERLAACLTRLRATLHDPIPPHLIESLTVNALPTRTPRFEPGSELLCDYSLTLTRLLIGQTLRPNIEQTLTGLLCDLTCYFTAELKAPRWLRTADGVKMIDEVAI